MHSNSECDSNNADDTSSPSSAQKIKKRNVKTSTSSSKGNTQQKANPKSRANTRNSTKQSTISASSYIDNLKDNSSLRSNSIEDDFNEVDLINSSVPVTQQKNEKLKSVIKLNLKNLLTK